MERIRLKNTGMGGFLTPPNHPEQKWCVEFDLNRKPENRGSMSLSYALTEDWLTPTQKALIQSKLDEWNKLPLEHKDTQEWINECQKHYAGLPSMLVKHIQQYYPEFKNVLT